MAGAVSDWATGGAGFSQQDVGVEALLHRPFMRTHTNRETCTPRAGWVIKKMCLGVPGIAACCKLEMACFPEERDKKWLYEKRRSISASDGWMSPKEQGPDGLNVCSWVQRRIHLQVYKTCSHRNVQLLLDCSHLQGTGSECCWFMASHSLRSVFVYVCEGGKKRRHGSILGSTLYIVPSGSGAHAAQPSCDLHASAAAWLCLSPAELFQSSSMARSSQGYACLTPLSHFSHASLWHIMEDARQFYCPWVKLHGNYCHMPRIHTHLQRGKVQILWSFHSFFSFPPVISLLITYWSLSTNPQKPNRATKNPLLSFKCPLRLNVSFLLRPHSSQRHSSLPLFYFSLAVLNSCCWLSYSRDC